ncbi:hypothetical protein SAMN05421874_13731 [Nonomuraea maritima]|uniref:Uncharacterized protein n=1 Tax=Nonomuraea maritima TaxID=683260 RepID=A0A1G9Q4Z9_9ACTN|nr:hypothetical protein [Nonomuraea maritima]SDM06124.1 hypothetical protein SAMN05421874_13731 [Nonomuraea maritima]
MLYSVIPALFQIALAVVLIAGAVLAGTRRHEHGRAATIGMAGFLVLLLEMVLSTVMLLVLPSLVSSLSGGLMASMVFTAVTLILRIGGIALLIWAVIARRARPPSPHRGPTQPHSTPATLARSTPAGPSPATPVSSTWAGSSPARSILATPASRTPAGVSPVSSVPAGPSRGSPAGSSRATLRRAPNPVGRSSKFIT